jgi:CubicO group peptidase (beta-lactamase class C family)
MNPLDPIDWVGLPLRPWKRFCAVPADLEGVTVRGKETRPRDLGLTRAAIERIWQRVEALYRTGLHPAIQLCVRHQGAVVLDRAIGYAAGNAPGEGPETPKTRVGLDTPFRLYSASKAITAMVIHKLDDLGALHIDDRVADYLPAFGYGARRHITIAHVLCHRAGIPALPPEAMDLELLQRPADIVELLARVPLRLRPGRRLAYHAVTGGFVLGEVVRAATGEDIRSVLRKEIREPLGLRWLDYGVAPEDAPLVARDALTGLPPLPPVAQVLERALGAKIDRVLELAHDPRFLSGILPAANVVSNARDLAAFFECLRAEGTLGGVRVFEPRTVRRATSEQSFWEADFTLGAPVRYGLGFMLGGEWLSLFGPGTPHAFGHVGLTNVFGWADPDRSLAAAIVTNGKPFIDVQVARLYQVLMAIGREFRRVPAA